MSDPKAIDPRPGRAPSAWVVFAPFAWGSAILAIGLAVWLWMVAEDEPGAGKPNLPVAPSASQNDIPVVTKDGTLR